MTTHQDAAASRSAASRGPVDSGASTGPRPIITEPVDYLALYRRASSEVTALTKAVEEVLRLHVRARRGRHRGGGACTECGFHWPCATVRALGGEDL